MAKVAKSAQLDATKGIKDAEGTEVVEEIQLIEATELSPEEIRAAKVKTLITRYAAVSAGLGFIPVPGLDMASVSSAQYAMIRDLGELYGYPTSKEHARVIATSMLAGFLPFALAASGGSLVKSIPVVGTIAGALLVPSLASAATIALGRVFVQHFETGGTLLDLNAEKLREHFKAEFEAAKLK